MKLTQAQFAAVQVTIDSLLQGSKRGSPERAAADQLSAEWEAVFASPQATFAQREARLAAIAAFAVERGLVGS